MRWTRELGGGASARVWGAEDPTGRAYAVKIGLEPDGVLLAREAECLAVARAPSLVTVLGGGRLTRVPWALEDEVAAPFLVLGMVRGTPLDRAGLEGTSSRLDLLLRDLADALEELHAAGIAHGDLKPSNVLVDGSEEAPRGTLIDLGLQAEASALEPRGGTPRYWAPEVWLREEGGPRGDGRARDLYALAATFAELLVPSLRDAERLVDAVRSTALPEPYEQLLRPLLADNPALRPSVKWLLSRGRALFDWAGGWESERRRRTVRREYLRVRQEELRRVAGAAVVDVLVEGPPGEWLREWLDAWRAGRDVIGPTESATTESSTTESSKHGPSGRAERVPLRQARVQEQRRWLVGVVGPSAAAWTVTSESDPALATRLLAFADQGPLEGLCRAQLLGSPSPTDGAQAPQGASQSASAESNARLDDPTVLALRLAELPVALEVLERIENLPDLHGELGVAAARAWRLRGEYARARLLASRCPVPMARIEAALAARRLGDRTAAAAELAALQDADGELGSLRAAQEGRELLDAGKVLEAEAHMRGHAPTAPLLETQSLVALARGEVATARARLEEARSLAINEEQLARLEGVEGLLCHAEARPSAALAAFQRAALRAERAGALLEEATYLTGVAAAATDRGELRVALPAAERATLLFEALQRQGEAARAALARAASYALLGAESELVEAAEEALWRARAASDAICVSYVHLSLSDGLTSNSALAAFHAEEAARGLARGTADDRLRVGARLLAHGIDVEVAELDTLARSASTEVRVEWWGARAHAAIEGRRVGGATERADGILEALLALAATPDLGVVRGPAFARGARLAVGLGRSEDARRLLSSARAAARELLAGTPDELQRHAQALDWVALASAPEGSRFAAEQVEEIERLVRSLGTRERLKPLLEQVLDALLLWTGVERGLLLLRAPPSPSAPQGAPGEEERLVVRAARNLARGDLQGAQLELSHTLARRALERGAPVVAVDAAGELSDVHRSVHALKLRSVLAVPLIARGETQGVVYLDDRVRRGAFGASELAWVKLVATLAAVAIADARDQLRLRRAARRAQRAEARMAEQLARREVELELAERELDRSRETRGDYSAIVGQSEPILALLRVVDRVAASEVPVLVQGESGSGKELVARAIHDNGPRRGKAFVAENCAAIPEPLLESTLFGHTRGAFTGAARQRAGLFEVAHGGTLFLDEIAEMPPAMQTKLLRVLQNGEIRPVGSERARAVDVRVVAATHRNLRERVEAGFFREDLFYRLNVIALRVPPLRERAADLPLLVRRFADLHGAGRGLELTPEALGAMLRYEWPGNVRQLENEVRRLLVLTEGLVRLEHLSPEIQAAAELPRAPDTLHLRTRVDALERELVETALRRTEGNQTRAAELLGLSRFGLQKMMKRLEVEPSTVARRRGRSGRGSPSGLHESR
ncbi:MAG: sigma 54-interacting transcriptional regulator [Myxococcales bacterium]|nr:sigma 54-interacting transcriptional regulator [Myxococcales bacterium]